LNFLIIIFVSVEGVQTNIVVDQLLSDLFRQPRQKFQFQKKQSRIKDYTHLNLECLPLLGRQTISLGNDRYNIDNFAELLHHNHVNGSEGVTGWVNEVQAAVNTSVLDVSVTHGGQFLTQVCAMLVFDIFDDGVPAGEN
jgi:hypothetical protein